MGLTKAQRMRKVQGGATYGGVHPAHRVTGRKQPPPASLDHYPADRLSTLIENTLAREQRN